MGAQIAQQAALHGIDVSLVDAFNHHCFQPLLYQVATAALSGLFPALVNSRTNLASALKQGGDRGGTAGRGRNPGQAVLVAAQVALTIILLISASLMARSFQALQHTPLGFDAVNRLTADLYLTNANYSNEPEYRHFFDALLERVRTLPGVTAADTRYNFK